MLETLTPSDALMPRRRFDAVVFEAFEWAAGSSDQAFAKALAGVLAPEVGEIGEIRHVGRVNISTNLFISDLF